MMLSLIFSGVNRNKLHDELTRAEINPAPMVEEVENGNTSISFGTIDEVIADGEIIGYLKKIVTFTDETIEYPEDMNPVELGLPLTRSIQVVTYEPFDGEALINAVQAVVDAHDPTVTTPPTPTPEEEIAQLKSELEQTKVQSQNDAITSFLALTEIYEALMDTQTQLEDLRTRIPTT